MKYVQQFALVLLIFAALATSPLQAQRKSDSPATAQRIAQPPGNPSVGQKEKKGPPGKMDGTNLQQKDSVARPEYSNERASKAILDFCGAHFEVDGLPTWVSIVLVVVAFGTLVAGVVWFGSRVKSNEGSALPSVMIVIGVCAGLFVAYKWGERSATPDKTLLKTSVDSLAKANQIVVVVGGRDSAGILSPSISRDGQEAKNQNSSDPARSLDDSSIASTIRPAWLVDSILIGRLREMEDAKSAEWRHAIVITIFIALAAAVIANFAYRDLERNRREIARERELLRRDR